MALPVKALKAGQESYWLDQITKNREGYFSGKGESMLSRSSWPCGWGRLRSLLH